MIHRSRTRGIAPPGGFDTYERQAKRDPGPHAPHLLGGFAAGREAHAGGSRPGHPGSGQRAYQASHTVGRGALLVLQRPLPDARVDRGGQRGADGGVWAAPPEADEGDGRLAPPACSRQPLRSGRRGWEAIAAISEVLRRTCASRGARQEYQVVHPQLSHQLHGPVGGDEQRGLRGLLL